MSVSAGLVALVMVRDQWVKTRWRRAARRLGLQFRAGCLYRGDKMWGQRGPYRLELDNLNRKHTSIVLYADRLPTNLHCGPRSLDDLPPDRRTGVGDRRFDRAVRVCGPRSEILARFNQRAQKRLLDALESVGRRTAPPIVITGGRVTYYAEYRIESAGRLERIVDQLCRIADALVNEEDANEQRPAPTKAIMRPRALSALLQQAQAADKDVASAAIRKLAQTGVDGWPGLEPLLIRALADKAYAVRLAAAETLAIVGHSGAVEPLQTLLRTSIFDPRLRIAARHAIRAIDVRAKSSPTGRLSLVFDEDARGTVSEAPPRLDGRGIVSESAATE